jgi:hypothetical protein
MVKYSFNADMRCVFERLAIAHRGTSAPLAAAEAPRNAARVIPFEVSSREPRLEIAYVALRQGHDEPREVAT